MVRIVAVAVGEGDMHWAARLLQALIGDILVYAAVVDVVTPVPQLRPSGARIPFPLRLEADNVHGQIRTLATVRNLLHRGHQRPAAACLSFGLRQQRVYTDKSAMARLVPDQDVPRSQMEPGLPDQQVAGGRSAGSLSWAGLANTYYWLDPTHRLTGMILMQILAGGDQLTGRTYGQFEYGVYKALGGG